MSGTTRIASLGLRQYPTAAAALVFLCVSSTLLDLPAWAGGSLAEGAVPAQPPHEARQSNAYCCVKRNPHATLQLGVKWASGEERLLLHFDPSREQMERILVGDLPPVQLHAAVEDQTPYLLAHAVTAVRSLPTELRRSAALMVGMALRPRIAQFSRALLHISPDFPGAVDAALNYDQVNIALPRLLDIHQHLLGSQLSEVRAAFQRAAAHLESPREVQSTISYDEALRMLREDSRSLSSVGALAAMAPAL